MSEEFKPEIKDLSSPEVYRLILWDKYILDPFIKFGVMFMSRSIADGSLDIMKRIVFAIPQDRRERLLKKWSKQVKLVITHQKEKNNRYSQRLNKTLRSFALPEFGTQKDPKDHRTLDDLNLLRSIYSLPDDQYTFQESFSKAFVTDLLNL